MIDFINSTRLSVLKNTDDILEAFYTFAKKKKKEEIRAIINDEKLKDGAGRFIERSIAKGYVDSAGNDLNKLLPPTSRRGGAREKKKESVLQKIRHIVEVFIGI